MKFVFLPARVIISVLALHFLPWDSHYILFFPLKEEGEYWPDEPRKPKETESEGAKSKKSGEMWERPGLNLSFAVKCSIFKLTVFSKLYSSSSSFFNPQAFLHFSCHFDSFSNMHFVLS